jgi:hypothetical protein
VEFIYEYYAYEIPPIDFWEGVIHLGHGGSINKDCDYYQEEPSISHRFTYRYLPLLQHLTEEAKLVTTNYFLTMLPVGGNPEMEEVFIAKIESNGTTYIISREPLPWNNEYLVGRFAVKEDELNVAEC